MKSMHPRDRLQPMIKNDTGKAIELQGQQRNNFMAELKMKILANAIIVFMKGFPGFSEWWFEVLPEENRTYVHNDLQVKILAEFPRLGGFVGEKATGIKDCVLRYFDRLPSFTQWRQVTLGADLRSRADHQLEEYIHQELRSLI